MYMCIYIYICMYVYHIVYNHVVRLQHPRHHAAAGGAVLCIQGYLAHKTPPALWWS